MVIDRQRTAIDIQTSGCTADTDTYIAVKNPGNAIVEYIHFAVERICARPCIGRGCGITAVSDHKSHQDAIGIPGLRSSESFYDQPSGASNVDRALLKRGRPIF